MTLPDSIDSPTANGAATPIVGGTTGSGAFGWKALARLATIFGLSDAALPGATRIRRDRLLFAVFALVAGSLDALLLIGWKQIDPTNLAWIRKDPAVYQAGWEFLRQAPWTFPPTWLPHLDYPFGISAAYLDVIPIVAVPLRLFAGILPENFQYLGLWAVLCLVLQTYFALKLLSRFTSDRLVLCLGALFFLNAPILLNRLYGHISLCSQWLILAALYYYFRPADRTGIARYMAPFAVLAAIAGGITPYITVMVLAIGLAAVFRIAPERVAPGEQAAIQRPRSAKWRNIVLWTAIPAAAALLAFLVFGFIVPGSGPSMGAVGYTLFSMNLFSPFNPGGPSLLFKPVAMLPEQIFEGYNYLGLGMMALGLACLIHRPQLLLKLVTPTVRPLIYVSILLTLAALSIRIVAGETVILTIPVTSRIFHLLAIFRSSGRFFWPVYYLLFLGALVSLLSIVPSRWARYAVLAAVCVVQYFDTLPLREGVAAQSSITVSNPFSRSPWTNLGRSAAHLIVLPAWQCGPARTPGSNAAWPWFARLAVHSGMTLNSVHGARSSAASDHLNCGLLPQRISRGLFERNSAYILGDRLALLAIEHDGTHYCRRVDGFNLCTFDPAHAALSRRLSHTILPPYILGTTFDAEHLAPRSMLMEGWDLRAAPARWTVGHRADIYLRPLLPRTGDLKLEMEFGGKAALLTARHRLQRAMVSVDGHRVGTWTFALGASERKKSLVIPRNLVKSRLVDIEFRLPDAVAPSKLGINSDGRQLGLYVSRIRIVGNQ